MSWFIRKGTSQTKQNEVRTNCQNHCFCHTHDLPLRGRRDDSGNFRVDSIDKILKNHLDNLEHRF